jgi:hypothetical protein
MTIWRPAEPADDDISDGPSKDPQNRRRRSRRCAWRHGFAAQTVVETLEDVRSYRTYERTFISGLSPRSVIELELVYGLANLLWRLRRARAIETGLLDIQSEFLLQSRQGAVGGSSQAGLVQSPPRTNGVKKVHGSNGRYDPQSSEQRPLPASKRPRPESPPNPRAMAQCFLRLSHLDGTLLERAGAYESRLWRQAAQTIWILDTIRRPPTAPPRSRFRKPLAHHFWDRVR